MRRAGAGAVLLGGLTGCGLQKDVVVPLPDYANQLVAECYLQNGVVPRLTITESVPYLYNGQSITPGSTSLQLPNGQTVLLPNDVRVNLTLPDGSVMPLKFKPGVDSTTGKVYTHVGTAPLVAAAGQQFGLDAQDLRGRHLTGSATVPTLVPIDSVKYKFNDGTGDDHKAYFMTRWLDPAATTDYYRLQLHLGGPSNDSDRDTDISDRLFNGQPYAQVTTYRYHVGDTITATLYHVDSLYYAFRQSTRDARNANGNPFAQAAPIRSTVQGGIGVFTVLVSDQRTVIVR